MKPEGASGLRNRQALPMVAIVDLAECLVIDHDDRGRCQARSWLDRAADVARMS
jgi:hypothetical protein